MIIGYLPVHSIEDLPRQILPDNGRFQKFFVWAKYGPGIFDKTDHVEATLCSFDFDPQALQFHSWLGKDRIDHKKIIGWMELPHDLEKALEEVKDANCG
jgi:hypothetical protein